MFSCPTRDRTWISGLAKYNMKTCPHCSQPFSTENKFCSRTCATTFTNANRAPRTKDSKLKTSESLKGRSIFRIKAVKYPHTKVKRMSCSFCDNQFWSKRSEKGWYQKLCSDDCFITSKRKNASGVKKQEYKGQTFDSGWEVIVAKWLDDQTINWVRPVSAIEWLDTKGKAHRYFADFYLPDYDLYLDPKNRIVIEKQSEKLAAVSTSINLIYGTPQEIFDTIGALRLS